MRLRHLLALVAALFVAASAAQAAYTYVGGQNPFGSVLGTGTPSSNASSGVEPWTDRWVGKTAYIAYGDDPNPAPMYYQETWTTPRSIFDLDVIANRPASGSVYVATSSGGPADTLVGTFDLEQNGHEILAIHRSNVYAIWVTVDGLYDHNHFQISEIVACALDHGPNLAPLGTQISSPNPSWDGAINDGEYTSEWRTNPSLPENFVGLEWAQTQSVQALRVVAATPHGNTWAWTDWELQLKQFDGNDWVWTPYTNTGSAITSDFWVDLEAPEEVRGVRLYGGSTDKIIDEIYVYGPVPEPTTLTLLAAAGLALPRRRTRPRR